MPTGLLEQAKRNKADEFYTQLLDIEAEMHHYKDQFKGKIVLCNCDDPYESNFFNCQMLCKLDNRTKGSR